MRRMGFWLFAGEGGDWSSIELDLLALWVLGEGVTCLVLSWSYWHCGC